MPGQATETFTRGFGIELEFNSEFDGQTTYGRIQAAGFSQDMKYTGRYGHDYNPTKWNFKTDSSVRSDEARREGRFDGFELASKVFYGKDGLDEMAASVKVLQDLEVNDEDMKLRVTKRCGLHVTVDVNDFTPRQVKNLVALVMNHEKAMFAMLPASRSLVDMNLDYGGKFCKPIRNSRKYRKLAFEAQGAQAIQDAAQECAWDRYFGLNLDKLNTRGLVEFRMGAGTLNAKKVKSWVVLILGIVERAKEARFILTPTAAQRASNTLDDQRKALLKSVRALNKFVGMKSEAMAASLYQTKRFRKFTNEAERNRAVAAA